MRKIALLLILAGLMLVGNSPRLAHGQGKSVLRRRLSAAQQRAEQAKKQVKQKRQQASEAKNDLVEAQKRLAAAEARLKRARGKLEKTQHELEIVRKELAKAKERLNRHGEAMNKRVMALFRSRQPSYIEVILHATSFTDFATRTRYTKMLCEFDQQVLLTLVEDKEQVETQQALLKQKEKQLQELEAKIERERNTVAQHAEEAEKLRHEALNDLEIAKAHYDEMQRIARDIGAQLRRLQGSGSQLAHAGSFSGRLLKPVSGHITSGFGYRNHPILGGRRFHNGIDIGTGGTASAISCADDGTVVFAGWKGGYGLTIIVDHGSGISTLYAHCKRGSVSVQPGQHVSRGQTIACVDSTGLSTGYHLHWTVFKNGTPVDPRQYY